MLYYRHKQPDKDENLRRQIEAVMVKHPAYGHKRIADDLKVSRKRARRVMKLYALKPARRARAPNKPHDVGQPESKNPDILSELSPIAPDTVWIADFTYIWFHNRHVYLSTVMDRFTREVLGVSIMTEHSAELVVRALTMALLGADTKPIWFHSDQGSEYTSYALTQILSKHGIQVSHSPKSSPWRNGSQESFFGRFKVEFGDPERFFTLPELMEAIYSYIAYYNTERIHTAHRTPPSTARATYQTKLTSYPQVMSLPPPALLRNAPPSRPCGAEEQPLLLI
jgi:transposase InsO family protein